MRAALALLCLVVVVTSCAQSCSGVGGIDDDMRFGSMHGDMRPSVDADDGAAPVVVGIDWPEGGAYGTIRLLYEAGKETGFVANDPVETPTNFGSDVALALTQASLANRLTYQDPCDVGPAIPCYYDDGADYWVDATVRSANNYLHDGSGATCYVLTEPSSSSGTNVTIFSTKTSAPASRGFRIIFSGGSTDRLQAAISNGSSNIIYLVPGSGSTGLQDQTWAAGFAHGTAQTPDFRAHWRGQTIGGSTNPTDYSSAPSTSDHATPMSIGASHDGTAAYLGWIFALACYDAIHSSTEVTAVWGAVEDVTGVLPQ